SSVAGASGLQADCITGVTESARRQRAISRFKRSGRRAQVLVNYGVLTTGFDAPKASAAVIARPTMSLVLYSQMVGRVIRGPLAGGTESCEIVTVADTSLPGFGNIAEAFLNWEDVWQHNNNSN
ncbi:MAG: helicase-related protein, partial [Acidimicrobiaceae bacterium]|nr:helicase-related protein [Acidimicrobiaceae bacterium]